jgi:hypothetical protein
VNNAQPEESEQSVACGALPDRGPESETDHRTNEPDFAENSSVVQNQERVGVAAKVGVESALDKPVSGPLSVARRPLLKDAAVQTILPMSDACDRQRSPSWKVLPSSPPALSAVEQPAVSAVEQSATDNGLLRPSVVQRCRCTNFTMSEDSV